MLRFYFDLVGKQNIDDPCGLAFENELQAYRAAERLAAELAIAQRSLRGATMFVVRRKDRGEEYYIAV